MNINIIPLKTEVSVNGFEGVIIEVSIKPDTTTYKIERIDTEGLSSIWVYDWQIDDYEEYKPTTIIQQSLMKGSK